MCNCGHEERDEAARLKRTAVTSAAGAAALAGIPAVLTTTHGHGALMAVIIAAQCGFIANAFRATARRRQLLRSIGQA